MKKQIYIYIAIVAVFAFFLGFFIAGSVITGNVISSNGEKSCSNLFECIFMKQTQEKIQEENTEQNEDLNFENKRYEEKDWTGFMSEEEFDKTYGECAEKIKSFVKENELIKEYEGELTEYEEYAKGEILRYLEENKIKERIESGEEISLIRESTEGELIPGEIYEEDSSNYPLIDFRYCAIKYKPSKDAYYHKGWVFWYRLKEPPSSLN